MRLHWPIILATVCFTLVACREEEQGRVLRYDKGVYSGTPMPVIDTATKETLRVRAQHQSF